MTKTIEFTSDVKFGEDAISSIEVHPIHFVELVGIWNRAFAATSKKEVVLQRARIMQQTHFMNGDKRIFPDEAQLRSLPLDVAKSIISSLELGQGVPGKVLGDGNGISSPVLYKLGTPISAKTGKGEKVEISELEFQATTYGEVEDVLASVSEMSQTIALIQGIAKPVSTTLMALPGWAIDRISVADGLTIMKEVLPRF